MRQETLGLGDICCRHWEQERRNSMQAAAKQTVTNVESIMAAIAAKIDPAAFKSWIAPCKLSVQNNTLFIHSNNQFSADFIKSVYSNTLGDVADEFGLGLFICVNGACAPAARTANDNTVKTFVPAAPVATTTTFDNFIISDENAFVVSACKKMASGAATFSPLFIYGAAGCGKSLLVDCINSESAGRTLVMTGNQFVSEFLRAMREHSVFAFKDFCRKCDTFIMDDVHTLAGKRASLDEFMNLVMDLRAANKNIVLTSNVAPGDLSGFDRRLQSLLASGLVADVATPSKNVARTIMARAGVAANVAEYLAGRINGDGHLIAGVAKKINTYAELMNSLVTCDVAERLLSDTLVKSKTPLAMVKSMCARLGVSYDAVCGTSRVRNVVRARQIMMTALKSATSLSLAEIGRLVGDRDHATVLYAISTTAKLKSSDLILGAEIDQMIAECR